jgi:hypothetical protein
MWWATLDGQSEFGFDIEEAVRPLIDPLYNPEREARKRELLHVFPNGDGEHKLLQMQAEARAATFLRNSDRKFYPVAGICVIVAFSVLCILPLALAFIRDLVK